MTSLVDVSRKICPLISALFFLVALLMNTRVAAEQNNEFNAIRQASTSGDVVSIYGVWEGGGRATEAIYGTMTITPTKISWVPKNHSPKCSTSYSVENETSGVTFRGLHNQYVTTQEPNTRYRTSLLKLKEKTCVNRMKYIRFIVDECLQGYLEYIDYDIQGGKGYGHFYFVNQLKQ